MKRVAMLMLTLTLVAACADDSPTPAGPSTSGPIVFTAPLSAANEVPPVSNAEAGGRGSVTVSFNVPRDSQGAITGPGTATFAMNLNSFAPGTPAILAHIHPGPAGVNGPILVNTNLSVGAPLLLGDGTVNVAITVNISQTDATNITANPAAYYFNVHTPLNPGGAVRGQLTRVQ
jgi:hypothetical protein